MSDDINILRSPEESGLEGDDLVTALADAIKAEPLAALAYADNYIEAISADALAALLAEAIKAEPEAALIHADLYLKAIPEDARAELLAPAIAAAPEAALDCAYLYLKFIPQQYWSVLSDAVPEDAPEDVKARLAELFTPAAAAPVPARPEPQAGSPDYTP